MNDPETRFEDAWREWASRPPRRTPAIAGQRVAATIRGRRRRRPAWLMAVASMTALLIVVVAGTWLLHNGEPPVMNGNRLAAPALGHGEVLIWLDEETPLYMTFQSPDTSDNGGQS